MCVRIESDPLPENDLDSTLNSTLNNSTINKLSKKKSLALADRIPKIWEIEAAKSTNFEVIDEKKAMEKETAYGLKVSCKVFYT